MRLLVTYRGLPWPISEGYHLRILHLFRRLAKRHEVHLLALVHEDEQRAQLPALEQDGLFTSIRMREVPGRNPLGRLRTNLGLSPVADFHAEYPGFAQALAQEVTALQKELSLDAGYIFDPWADLWYQKAAKVLPTLLDVCDCRTLFYERRLERGDLGLGERMRTRQLRRRFLAYEQACLDTYPVSTVVSPHDRDRLVEMRPNADVHIIPNGVDLEMFQPLPDVEEHPGNLIMFGNMDFLPNVDASIRLAREILPLVRKRHPHATATIIGTNPLPEVQELDQLPGVEVTGRVEDLKPWIQRSSMLVAPMRFGAGIKNKVLESMAVEKPVVTNATGVEAMHADVAALLTLAESNEEFAAAISDLLDQPEQRATLGKQGRETMARLHSWETAAEAYEALLQRLASQ
jgi:glycosyltransferase involved in cell wall biosynthesis